MFRSTMPSGQTAAKVELWSRSAYRFPFQSRTSHLTNNECIYDERGGRHRCSTAIVSRTGERVVTTSSGSIARALSRVRSAKSYRNATINFRNVLPPTPPTCPLAPCPPLFFSTTRSTMKMRHDCEYLASKLPVAPSLVLLFPVNRIY